MTEMIAERVTGVLDVEEFNMRLTKGISTGGLGMSEVEADDITRHFEKVIAQGVDVSYKG